jgi:hypothetical protein
MESVLVAAEEVVAAVAALATILPPIHQEVPPLH